MWWNAISLFSIIVVPGVFAAVALAAAMGQTGEDTQSSIGRGGRSDHRSANASRP